MRGAMSLFSITSRSARRVFAGVFVAIGVAATVFIVRQPRWYEASAIVQVKLESEMGGATHAPAADMTSLLEAGSSNVLIVKVEARLSESEQTAFLRAHDHPMKDGYPLSVMEVIAKGRRVMLGDAPRTLVFQVRDRDPEMAARLANLFAEELLGYTARVQIGDGIHHVVNLKPLIEMIEERIRALSEEHAAYREERRRLTGVEFEPDAHSQELEKRLAEARQHLDQLRERERRIRALFEPPPNPLRVLAWATPVEKKEGVLEPEIVAELVGAWGLAALAGLLAVRIARRREARDRFSALG